MSTFRSLEEVWRRSLDLNLRYYGAVGQLTVNYIKDLMNAVAEVQQRDPMNFSPQPHQEPVKPPTAEGSAAGYRADQEAGTMVLEGESGSRILGVFLVENHLSRPISARVEASTFIAANGDQIKPAIVFDPEVVALGPGEQSLVRVLVLIDDTLDVEVRYLGQFTIPELLGTRIPVVLRRRLGSDVISVASTSVPAEETPGKAASKSKKSSSRGRAKKGSKRSARTKKITS